jgi:hypothetical protein
MRGGTCPYSACDVSFRALAPSARYEVTIAERYDIKERLLLTGRELTQLKVEIGQEPGSTLIRYRKLEP